MDSKHNNGGNGFLIGVMLGAIGTLLFTTKKGREIVREVTDKGLEKFSEFENALQESEKEFEEIEDSDYIESEPIQDKPKEIKKEDNSSQKTQANGSAPSKEKTVRRFFKGSKKN